MVAWLLGLGLLLTLAINSDVDDGLRLFRVMAWSVGLLWTCTTAGLVWYKAGKRYIVTEGDAILTPINAILTPINAILTPHRLRARLPVGRPVLRMD